MADQAKRDQNFVTTLLAVSSVDGVSPVALWADPTTHRLLVDSTSVSGMSIGGTITSGTEGSVLFVGPGGVLAQDNANFFWNDSTNTLSVAILKTSSGTYGLTLVNNRLEEYVTNGLTSVALNFDGYNGGTTQFRDVVVYNGKEVVIAKFEGTNNKLILGLTGTTTGQLEMDGATSGAVTIKTAAVAGTWTLTLPTSAGSSGQFLQTNGSGVTSWSAVTATPGGSDTQVQFNDAGSLAGDAGFVYNKTTDTATVGILKTLSGGYGLTLINNRLEEYNTNGLTSVALNYNGYNGGTTQFRDVVIYDGKTVVVAKFDGGNNKLVLGLTGTTTGQLEMDGATSGAVTIKTAAAAGTWTLTLPVDDGTANQYLKTDGNGVTSWATASNPSSDDGAALGSTSLRWSDLFLAEGGVINWDNGDATLTQTNNTITWAGIDTFNVGTTTSVGLGTIELGHATDTTIARVSAGVVSIEGVNIVDVSSSQTLTNKTLTSPVLTTPSAFTTGGTITLAENTTIALDPAGSADGKFTGTTVTAVAGYAQTYGDLVYLDPTDSRWEMCDANSAQGADGDSRGIIGIVAVAGANDGSACTILLQGIIRADAKFPTFTINNPIYVSETAGAVTQTQPTTTDVVIRVVGFGITADEMYFNPSGDYITHV